MRCHAARAQIVPLSLPPIKPAKPSQVHLEITAVKTEKARQISHRHVYIIYMKTHG